MSSMNSAPLPTATHILLTHIPPFLRHPRNMRDLLLTTGLTKHVAYTCPIKRHASDNKKEDDENLDVAAVIKLNHVSQAMTFLRNWEKARDELKSTMKSFLWYEGDGLLPVLYPEKSNVDRRMLENLWNTIHGERKDDEVGRTAKVADESFVQKLVQAYRLIEVTQEQLDTGIITINRPEQMYEKQDNQEDSDKKLDKAKVAAAAGGAYDDEADPLNAKEVLEAVAQFRKKLEETQGGYKTKRAAYVNDRLKSEVKKAKEKIIQRRKDAEEAKQKAPPLPVLPPLPTLPPPLPTRTILPPLLPGSGPIPPLPTNVPPLPGALPPSSGLTGLKRPVPSTEESAAKKFKTSDDANGRKIRLDVAADESSLADIRAKNEAADRASKAAAYLQEAKGFTKEHILSKAYFPLLRKDHMPDIRKFVKEQMVEYLGEEEATLIDFVMNYLKKENEKERVTTGLLEEMKIVLEEDSEAFVFDVFQQVIKVIGNEGDPSS